MKNITAFLVILFFLPVTYTQTTFSKKFHFNYPSAVLCSIYPTDTCYYATGIIVDTVFPNLTGSIFVKFNIAGEEVFNKVLKSPDKYYETWFGDLAPTSDGHLIGIGQTTDSLYHGLVVKYNTDGDTIVKREFLSPYYPTHNFIVPTQISIDSSGNIFILSAISKANGDNDLCISLFDNQLNLLEDKTFGNLQDEIPGNSLLLEDGKIIFGANRDNTNTNDQNLWSRSWIVKTDTAGQIEWQYLSPSGTIQDGAMGIVRANDGGHVVATTRGFEKPVNPELSFLYWDRAYFFKLDGNQNVVWELEVMDSINPGPIQGLERLIAVDSGNAYVAAGHFNMIRSYQPPIGGTFGWFYKISDNGELIWIRKYQILQTLGHYHKIYDLKPTPDGGFVTVSEIHGNWGTGEPQLQAWLLKLDSFGCLIPGCQANDTVSVTATAPEQAKVELAIYPNPTTDYLNFQLRTPQPLARARFRILDAAGRTVKDFSSDSPKDTYIVPVWDWAPGVYFLQYVEEGMVRASERFIISSP